MMVNMFCFNFLCVQYKWFISHYPNYHLHHQTWYIPVLKSNYNCHKKLLILEMPRNKKHKGGGKVAHDKYEKILKCMSWQFRLIHGFLFC